MRILILQQSVEKRSDYADYVSLLITDYAHWLGYENIQINSLNHVKAIQDNCIILFEENHSWNLFFEKKLSFFISKNNINVLVDLRETLFKLTQHPRLSILMEPDDPKKKISKTKITPVLPTHSTFITYAHEKVEKMNSLIPEKNAAIYQVPYTASHDFKELDWPEKVLIKAQYTGNKEYFLCMGCELESELLELLKGFSKFKKWQQSSMQLLIILDEKEWLDHFKEKLNNYRYKEDVQMMEEVNMAQYASLFAAAYCFIHPTNNQGSQEALVSALQCSIPVICLDSPALHEYAEEAALYMPVWDSSEISKNMIGIYKNENHKTQMEGSARVQAQKYKREEVEKKLWALLETQCGKK
ncbi:MAG: glycosyltransferase [Bacteroidetes bacterium]|nr:glycosyltransferase [Bacteroidota bacterium]